MKIYVSSRPFGLLPLQRKLLGTSHLLLTNLKSHLLFSGIQVLHNNLFSSTLVGFSSFSDWSFTSDPKLDADLVFRPLPQGLAVPDFQVISKTFDFKKNDSKSL